MPVDVLVFGGGIAGLWLLDDLVRIGRRALLIESGALGQGQTVASQGIIHSGLKYTLAGKLTASARSIREMPGRWRRSLAGEQPPDLTATRLRSDFCYLWQTSSFRSRFAMIGARRGLRVKPIVLDRGQRPPMLRDCPGVVARLDEQVIEPVSLLGCLVDQHMPQLLKIDSHNGVEIEADRPGAIDQVRLINSETGEPLDLLPANVVLTAGAGNAHLRRLAGLEEQAMQLRPLHMVMARGDLPELNGHCVDGFHTRVTITSTRDYANRVIWQVGGQIAEDGVDMKPRDLVRHARNELRAVLPGFNPDGHEWASYRVDRAEPATRGTRRPEDIFARREGNTITAWPTKMALAPQLASQIIALLDEPTSPAAIDDLDDWPRPDVAIPPWEDQTWHVDH